MSWISDNILRAICWALLHSLWQGLIFALVAGVILVLTKKASSALRYNLLCSGMVLFLAVSGYTFYTQLRIAGADEASASWRHAAVQPGRADNAGLAQNAVAVHATGVHEVAHATTGASEETGFLRHAVDSLVQYFNTHASLVVVIWFIVFLARFVRLLSGMVYAQRIRHYQTSPAPGEWQQRLNELLGKLRVSRPVALLESGLIKVPMVVGFIKPVVLVPIGMLAHLPADQVESILLHELAHIRRRDHLFNLVQHLVDTLFFFNPAIVWISSLIRAERENCCDDIAIRETRSRRQLIEALVSFHEYRQSFHGFAVSFANENESPLVKRVKRIVHKTNHSLNAGERLLLMSGLLILTAAFVTINGSYRAADRKKTTGIPAATVKPTVQAEASVKLGGGQTSIGDTTIKPVKKKPAATTAETSQEETKTTLSDTTTNINYLGYRNLSLDKLIQLREHGVTADYILSFRKMGYADLSPDQAIELRDHGVTVEFIQEFQDMGYKNISLRQAKDLIDHGVNTGYIKSLKDIGYTDINLNEATEARDHGVTTGFIGKMNELGFSHLSLRKAQELVDHGVTADYIASCKKRFGKLFELNDYIKLREAGINPEE
jgi:bla regulator protein BlaR1